MKKSTTRAERVMRRFGNSKEHFNKCLGSQQWGKVASERVFSILETSASCLAVRKATMLRQLTLLHSDRVALTNSIHELK